MRAHSQRPRCGEVGNPDTFHVHYQPPATWERCNIPKKIPSNQVCVVEVVSGRAAVYQHVDRAGAPVVPLPRGWPGVESRAVLRAGDAAEAFELSVSIWSGCSSKKRAVEHEPQVVDHGHCHRRVDHGCQIPRDAFKKPQSLDWPFLEQ